MRDLPLAPAAITRDFTRADLIFYGVEHGAPPMRRSCSSTRPRRTSRRARVETGFAGSFVVVGHGGSHGEAGLRKVPAGPRDPFDTRPPHGLTPQTKLVDITEAIRHPRCAGDVVTIAVLPILPGPERARQGNVLFFSDLRLFLPLTGLGDHCLPVLTLIVWGRGSRREHIARRAAKEHTRHQRTQEAEDSADAEGQIEAVGQRPSRPEAASPRVCASAIVLSTARPSAPPISREVFSSPEPRPLSRRRQALHRDDRRGHQREAHAERREHRAREHDGEVGAARGTPVSSAMPERGTAASRR